MTGPRKFEIPAIPPEFIVRLPQAKGKEFITANGLIYLAHLQGLKRVDVQVLREPTTADPTAYVRCEVETDLGVFSDYGEVSPANKGTVGGQYPLSMATTRARNRALRIATGCPLTSYEEIGMESVRSDDEDEDTPAPRQETRHAPRQQQQNGAQQPQRPAPSLAVVPPNADVPGSCQPASKDQLERLVKLQAALGRAKQVPDGLSFEEAAAQIKDLVVLFNERAGKGGKK